MGFASTRHGSGGHSIPDVPKIPPPPLLNIKTVDVHIKKLPDEVYKEKNPPRAKKARSMAAASGPEKKGEDIN